MTDRYRSEIKAVLDDLLLTMPGVSVGKAFGYPAYRIERRVFCFVGGEGIALKLPEPRVRELIAEDSDMHPFGPVEGMIWRSWIAIDHIDPEIYEQDLPLFEESIAYTLDS